MISRTFSRAVVAPRLTRTNAVANVRMVKPRGSNVVVKAESKEASSGGDFDAILMNVADKFEKAENKPVVIGYCVAAVAAFVFSEWLLHLPALDILLGFPVQMVGIISLPILINRYVLESKDVTSELSTEVESIVKKLPGLQK